MADDAGSLPVIAVTAAVGAVVLLIVLLCSIGRGERKEESEDAQETSSKTEKSSEKQSRKSKLVPKVKKSAFVPFTHKWLSCTLKGHSSRVVSLDFSSNGKYLVTASDDRVMMLWSTREFQQKEHKFIRMNVELDSVTNVKFSPDSKAVVASLANSNTVRIFRLGKKEDGSGNIGVVGTFDFPKTAPADIMNVGVSSKGTFIMAGLTGTQLIIYDLKGEQIEAINTHQMQNNFSCVSPCGRFVASSGFTPDVKIWEVTGTPGELKVTRAMELKGHTSGVFSFSFNGDSTRVATVSKDGTWKLWDTDVRYSQGQDAKLLFSGPVSVASPNLIAISPDGRTVAIAGESNVVFWDAVTYKELETLHSLHAEHITSLQFDISNKFLVTSGDKHLQVVHNVPGYKATIVDLKQREKKATSSGMRDRIQEAIERRVDDDLPEWFAVQLASEEAIERRVDDDLPEWFAVQLASEEAIERRVDDDLPEWFAVQLASEEAIERRVDDDLPEWFAVQLPSEEAIERRVDDDLPEWFAVQLASEEAIERRVDDDLPEWFAVQLASEEAIERRVDDDLPEWFAVQLASEEAIERRVDDDLPEWFAVQLASEEAIERRVDDDLPEWFAVQLASEEAIERRVDDDLPEWFAVQLPSEEAIERRVDDDLHEWFAVQLASEEAIERR
ncbi:hypothetical protein BaRGS_00009655, partial [Batillaria attramentaria]